MRIGEIASRAGLTTSAIRYYERLGLLPAPPRRGGRRSYGAEILDAIAVVRFARACGFSMLEIRELLAERPYSAQLRRLASRKIAELDERIRDARTMQAMLATALRCRCLDLEECGRHLRRAARQTSRERGSPAARDR